MPNRFVSQKDTHRIELKGFDGSDDWVDIRAHQREADRRRLQDIMVYTITNPNGGGATTLMDSRRHFVEMLKAHIVDWSFRQDDEDPSSPIAPINEIWLMNLNECGDYILNEMDRYYTSQRMSQEERDRLKLLPSPGTSAAAPGSRNGSNRLPWLDDMESIPSTAEVLPT